MSIIQAVDINDQYKSTLKKTFGMIDNYVYLYHTKTLIAIPLYPEVIQDSMSVTYSSQTPMLRTAPIYSYSSSGPRSMNFTIPLHRDMMNEINLSASKLNIDFENDDDYVDTLVKQLQAAAVPKFNAAEKMVNPPIVAVRFGNSIFCKGVVEGQVTVEHSGPILMYDKYALVTVSFTVSEVDPYDASSIMQLGGYRGLSTTLSRRIWKK